MPLAVLAALGAARLFLADPGTRRLLVPLRSALALAAAGAVAMVGATTDSTDFWPASSRPCWLRLQDSTASRSGARLRIVAATARVLAVALLYGACHLTSGSPLLAFVAASCGLAWGLLRVAGRSLWPSIIAHAAWDLAILVAWPLA